MTSSVAAVSEALGAEGLHVSRSWPRAQGHLLLDLVDERGGHVAGQWFSDEVRAQKVADQTASTLGERHRSPGSVRRIPASGVVLQPGGADRQLPALAELLQDLDSTLVTHRPERRAVVQHRDPDGTGLFTKVVRPRHVLSMLASSGGEASTGVSRPVVTEVHRDRGTVTTVALPGRTLHELLADPDVPHGRLAASGRACGAAVAAVHRAPVAAGAPRHDPIDELRVTERWVRDVADHEALDADELARLRSRLEHVSRQMPSPVERPAPIHRDLHDLQILVDWPCPHLGGRDAAAVGLLDFDLATTGDPALDLSNLLVHLELRMLQGHTTRERAAVCAEGLRAGYGADEALDRRLSWYGALTRMRLAAVYAFRPADRDRVVQLLDEIDG